jgi:hypothetical protein
MLTLMSKVTVNNGDYYIVIMSGDKQLNDRYHPTDRLVLMNTQVTRGTRFFAL